MAWAPLLLTLFAHCTGGRLQGILGGLLFVTWEDDLSPVPGNGICPVLTGSWAEVVLTQPRSVLGSLEQKVTISCTRSSGNFGSYYVHWYQQRPGSALTTVIYKDDQRPSGVPNRFSGSIDTSSSAAYLTISGLQPEEEANYYCQSGYDSNKDTVLQTHGEVRSKFPRASLSRVCL